MKIANFLIDFFLHIDKHLVSVVATYGVQTYLLLFLIIFLETGLVVTPFLPGDSLLFAAGALAGEGSFHLWSLLIVLVLAAFLGDTANYWFGHFLGPKVSNGGRFLKKEYLDKAHRFYEKHGGKAIVLARFVPIVRTFAPFVAGMAKMSYFHFLVYNVVGGIVWVLLFVLAGFFFGSLPFVKENFHHVMLGVIFISIVPIIIEWWKARSEKKKEAI